MRRLLIRPGAIGDCIVSLPALQSLSTKFTEVWTTGAAAPLMRFADRVCSIAAIGLDLLELPEADSAAVVERLRGFDSIVSWYGSGRMEFRCRVGELGLPFHFLPALPPMDGDVHAVDFFLEQARRLGGKEVPAEPRVECRRENEGFVVIHPFSGSATKNWPLQRYRELAARLPGPVYWCAGPEDELENAVRIENLYELACWLARAKVFIGNDSGIGHLAAAAGTPVVTVFGPTNPLVWAPRGSPGIAVRMGMDVTQVSVGTVASAVASLVG